jgi:hypothetical protein
MNQCGPQCEIRFLMELNKKSIPKVLQVNHSVCPKFPQFASCTTDESPFAYDDTLADFVQNIWAGLRRRPSNPGKAS